MRTEQTSQSSKCPTGRSELTWNAVWQKAALHSRRARYKTPKHQRCVHTYKHTFMVIMKYWSYWEPSITDADTGTNLFFHKLIAFSSSDTFHPFHIVSCNDTDWRQSQFAMSNHHPSVELLFHWHWSRGTGGKENRSGAASHSRTSWQHTQLLIDGTSATAIKSLTFLLWAPVCFNIRSPAWYLIASMANMHWVVVLPVEQTLVIEDTMFQHGTSSADQMWFGQQHTVTVDVWLLWSKLQ